MGDDHFLQLQPGTVVNGRYEIVKCLGAGSMGMVYACRHRELAGHLVAMKVLFTEVARDSVAAARFRNEIVASYGVSHPNVVRAYEYFRDGDLIAFTMEYINGGDLADKITGEHLMEIPEIIRMLAQMCSGVQAIHDAGIIHRDLKPENILLASSGDIKITDFGIARTGTGPKLTEHGGVVGTIDYVSPEYLERGQVDARSDIYSLGVISYEMITGDPPFKGKSVIETMTMRLKTDPKEPHLLRSDCPPELSQIVLRAMARDPEERYQSAAEMQHDLEVLRGNASGEFAGESRTPAVTRGRTEAPERKSAIRGAVVGGVAGGSKRRGSDPEKMESVLKNQSFSGLATQPRGPEISHPAPPPVAVSHSHLSADRIRKLSSEVSQDDSVWSNLLLGAAVLLVGFGVGIVVLRYAVGDRPLQPLGINEELLPKAR